MFKKKTKKIYLCGECSPTIHSKEPGQCPTCDKDLKEFKPRRPFFISRWFGGNKFGDNKKEARALIIWRRLAVILLIWLIITNISFSAVMVVIMSKKNSQFNPEDYQDEAAAYIKFKAIKKSFIPSGIPGVYGQELNISFDQVQDAINKVALLDPTYGQKKITLTGSDLERYIKIGSRIACEYCCGVTTLVFENGEAACGCDHSQMMRGLSAYLIKNHPREFTDEQILGELTKWKRTYFPKQTLSAELDRLAKSGEQGIEQILKEFPDFLPQMVGGC